MFETLRSPCCECLATHAASQPTQVCLFSYGQTGAGKTHTMQGGAGQQEGIIPRSMHKVRTGFFD